MPEDILVRLGIHLKKARESRDMTQQRISDVSGIAVRTISKIERGQMNPSFELLSILIPFLGISFDSLFTHSDNQIDADLQEIAFLYRSCSTQGQRLLLALIHAFVHEIKKNESELNTD